MHKNKSKKNKVPVLDEKSYAAYLEYLKSEGNSEPRGQQETPLQVSGEQAKKQE